MHTNNCKTNRNFEQIVAKQIENLHTKLKNKLTRKHIIVKQIDII